MAKTIIVKSVDDIDKANGIETPAASEPFNFGLGDQWWEIDLGEENEDALRTALAPFIAVAKKVSKRTNIRRPVTSGNTKLVRQWAIAQGYQISPKGAIPKEIRLAYESANQTTETEAV